MDNISWKSWAFRVCSHIRFKPDRGAVEEELLAHLEDKSEAILREKDVTVSEAEKQALASMGDPDEVGRKLAAVHRPWLGYLWLWSRRAVILCIVVVIWAAWGFSERVFFTEPSQPDDLSVVGEYGEYYQWAVLYPDCVDHSDGYTFTVPHAAIRHNEAYMRLESNEGQLYERMVEESAYLSLTVRATSLLPSTEGCTAFRDFYAVDDLGNHYWSSEDPEVIYTWQTQRSLRGNFHATGLWTSEYEAWISEVDPSASWIELRYDRGGRDVRLRIDLTGGEGT